MIYIIKLLSRQKVFTVLLMWCVLMLVVNFYGTEAAYRHRPLSISEKKCQEYMKEINNRPRRWKRQETEPTLGIYHGNKTRPMEYAHMGALGWYSVITRDWKFQCGATLISSNFVLTAAHCTKIAGKDLKNFNSSEPQIVRMGARNIRKSRHEMFHDFHIAQIVVHEKYCPPKTYYDIALLKLSRLVSFTNYLHPACLGTPSASYQKYTVTGWGAVERAGEMVNELRYGAVDLIDNRMCDIYRQRHKYRNWNITAPHQICAGKMDGSIDTCNGDSGGPLQYNKPNTPNFHIIIGITAFGSIKCATRDLPSVYTRVAFFIPWIEKIVWPSEIREQFNENLKQKRYSLPRKHRKHRKHSFNNIRFF